jgi:hypothetical protein
MPHRSTRPSPPAEADPAPAGVAAVPTGIEAALPTPAAGLPTADDARRRRLRAPTPRAILWLVAGAGLLAVTGATPVMWVLGAALLATPVLPGLRTVGATGSELQRHLAGARRRGTHCDMLVMRFESRLRPSVIEGLALLRTTDSAELRPAGPGGRELHVLFDDLATSRVVMEQRLLGTGSTGVACGWSRFPQDGLTVETLAAAARAAMPPPTAHRARIRRQRPFQLVLRRDS